MDRQGQKWFAELQLFAQKSREAAPLPDRGTLSIGQEMQCRIVGGTLLAWLRGHGPQFLQEREVLHKVMKVSPDPWIVFTSNVPGLVAARDIVGTGSQRTAYLREDEFRRWLGDAPDARFRWHVHFWSLFLDEPEGDFVAEAARRHPIAPPCVYWQHAEGTMWGASAGRGGDHLWKWDGIEPIFEGLAVVGQLAQSAPLIQFADPEFELRPAGIIQSGERRELGANSF